MLKAISYWSLGPSLADDHTIEDALAMAEESGYQALELTIGPNDLIKPDATAAHCQVIRSAINESPVAVESVATGMAWSCNPVSDDPQVRQQSLELHIQALKQTAELGCAAMLYVPGVVGGPLANRAVRYDEAIERAADNISQLLDVAKSLDVDLCVENVWNGMFYSPVELADFIDSFDHPNLGIYLDVGNLMGYHQYPPHWIEILGSRIRRVHIKDFKRALGSLAGFCDLMAGDVPWRDTMAALRQIGYDGPLVAEMMPWDSAMLARTSVAMDTILSL